MLCALLLVLFAVPVVSAAPQSRSSGDGKVVQVTAGEAIPSAKIKGGREPKLAGKPDDPDRPPVGINEVYIVVLTIRTIRVLSF